MVRFEGGPQGVVWRDRAVGTGWRWGGSVTSDRFERGWCVVQAETVSAGLALVVVEHVFVDGIAEDGTGSTASSATEQYAN